MDGIKGMKFPKKPSLTFPKFSSSENKPNDTSLPTSSSTPERDGLRHPSSDDSGQQEEQINSGNNESEKHSKLKFPVGLASIDLDPLRVKDQMGRLGGKMKSSLNKMSDKIPSSKKSSNEIDEFDKVIQNIENDELKKNNEITPPETSSGTELQREQQQEQEEHDHHKTKSVVAQITNVKGKLNKLGKAAKQRLSSIHQSSPFNVEENDSAHSSASKDSNNSLTATARLSRAFPVLLPSTSANLDNSSDPLLLTPQTLPPLLFPRTHTRPLLQSSWMSSWRCGSMSTGRRRRRKRATSITSHLLPNYHGGHLNISNLKIPPPQLSLKPPPLLLLLLQALPMAITTTPMEWPPPTRRSSTRRSRS
jgi:hypothetical protein